MKRSPLIILAVTLFIDLLGFGLILPLIPVYIQHYGGTSAVGGLLMASFSVMQFIFSPIWGGMSDRVGRRPMILLSLIGSAISFLAFGLAPNLAVLFIARIAAGALSAASLPTAQAYIADVTTPDKRAGGMAVLGAAFGLGFAFGPLIGGVFSKYSVFGAPALATPAFVAALLCAGNFIWAFFMLPESHTDRSTTQEKKSVLDVFPTIMVAIQNPAFRAQLLVFAFATFAFVAVESSFSWLVLYRFDHVLTGMAAQYWQTLGHNPLKSLPADISKLIPKGVDWHAFSRTPYASLSKALQRGIVERESTTVTTEMFKIVGLTILVVQVAVIRGLARKVGEHRLVRFGALLLTVTLFGIALAPSISLIYVLCALVAIGNGVMNPSLSAMITHSAGPQERGTLSGAQQGLSSLARIIAPPVNNYLVGVNTAIPFFSSAAIMSVAFVLSLRLRPLPHRTAHAPEATAGVPAAVGE